MRKEGIQTRKRKHKGGGHHLPALKAVSSSPVASCLTMRPNLPGLDTPNSLRSSADQPAGANDSSDDSGAGHQNAPLTQQQDSGLLDAPNVYTNRYHANKIGFNDYFGFSKIETLKRDVLNVTGGSKAVGGADAWSRAAWPTADSAKGVHQAPWHQPSPELNYSSNQNSLLGNGSKEQQVIAQAQQGQPSDIASHWISAAACFAAHAQAQAQVQAHHAQQGQMNPSFYDGSAGSQQNC